MLQFVLKLSLNWIYSVFESILFFSPLIDQILSMMKERFWASLVSRRKNLILNVEPTRRNISDIACFLQTSPKLESLQINLASSHGASRKVVESQKTSSSCLQVPFYRSFFISLPFFHSLFSVYALTKNDF